MSTHSYRRWKARLDEQAPTAATKRISTCKPAKATRAAIAPFVDLGSLGTLPAAAGRLELRLDLGGGVTLHLVRG